MCFHYKMKYFKLFLQKNVKIGADNFKKWYVKNRIEKTPFFNGNSLKYEAANMAWDLLKKSEKSNMLIKIVARV